MEDFEIKREGSVYEFDTKLNIDQMIDVVRHYNKKRIRLNIFLLILSIIYLVYIVIQTIKANDFDSYMGLIFFFGFSSILAAILLYRYSKKLLRKAIINQNSDIIDSVIHYEFHDDSLYTKVEGKELSVEKKMKYSFIQFISKTKSGINYIATKDRRTMVIESEEILAFIKAKLKVQK